MFRIRVAASVFFAPTHNKLQECLRLVLRATVGVVCLGATFAVQAQTATTAPQAFPTTAVNAATPATVSVNFNITGSGTLGTTQVLTQGTANLDFTLGTGSTCTGAVTSGSTCFVTVNFTPLAAGLRLGAVNLTNAGGAVIATAFLSGTGTAPQASFSPAKVTTFAGHGSSPSTCPGSTNAIGDGCTATNVRFDHVPDVKFDAAGNLYVVDFTNYEVRKVAAGTGIVTSVAGNGSAADTGDNGPATSAGLYGPMGVAIDGAGNLYISEYYGSRIRKVTAATGIITTIAGNGSYNYSGDGGQATAATVNGPWAIAVDVAGNVYFTDRQNNRVRKITVATGVISLVAGNGSQGYLAGDNGGLAVNAELNNPQGITVDASGTVVFADTYNSVIRSVSTGGTLSLVAGTGTPGFAGDGGLATSAGLYNPFGVVFDPAGDLYIGDFNSNRVRKVSISTGKINTVAGSGDGNYNGDGGLATSAAFNAPMGVALDAAGNLYIADYNNAVVREVPVTPYPMSFPTATAQGSADTTDGILTRTLSNVGNADLVFPAPGSVGSLNPSVPASFLWDNSSTCNQLGSSSLVFTLSSGLSCTESIAFAPAATGSISGSVVTTDNNLNVANSTQSFALSGTGNAPAPAITGISPNNGAQAGNTLVTITGSAFTGATQVKFGGTSATGVTVVNDTTITAHSPAASAGTVDVKVTSPAGTSATTLADQYTYNVTAPTVTGLSPTTGNGLGGTAVSISGSGFSSATSVLFGTASATFTIVNANLITATSPAGSVGSVDVTVTNPGGTSTTSPADQYTYFTPAPVVTSVAPNSGTTLGGTSVTLTGSYFNGVTAVSFGSTSAVFSVVNNTTITVTSPVVAGAGAVPVTVANTTGTSTPSTASLFTYYAPQTISFPTLTTPAGDGTTAVLGATSSSGLPVTYSIVGGTGTATITGSSIAYTSLGTVIIEADQAGNGVFLPAAAVQQTITIAPQPTSYTVPGTTPVNTTSGVQTAYINFPSGGTLGTIAVLTQGALNTDFDYVGGGTCSVSVVYTAGQACSVLYSFKPTGAGVRKGAVVLTDSSSNVLGTSYLSGIGTSGVGVVYPGTQTQVISGLGDAFQLATDTSGNLFIGGYGAGTVYKETLSAGVFTQSTIGSGLANPAGIAVDGVGNVYIVDQGNGRVVKETLNAAGTSYTQTVAFSGFPSMLWAVASDAAGNVYVSTSNTIYKETLNLDGTYTQSTVDAGFQAAIGLAIDGSGNLYVGDASAGILYKETVSGGSFTRSTIASGLANVNGIAVDAAGTLYVAASDASHSVLRYAPNGSGGYVAMLPLGGNIARVNGVALDPMGDVYVSSDLQSDGNYVYKIDVTGPQTLPKFPDTVEGTASAAVPVTLYNIGNSPLSISSFFSPDGNFRMTGSPCSVGGTVASGAQCALNVQFTPLGQGDITGSAVEQDNTLNLSGTNHVINSSGRGLSNATLLLSPSNISFANTTVGTTSNSWTATLSNESGEDVKMIGAGIDLEGVSPTEFTETSTCGAVLPKYTTCNIIVTFHPDAASVFNATLVVKTYTVASPYTTTLTGTGTAVLVALSPVAVDFSTVTVGGTSPTQSVQLSNNTNGSVAISNTAITGANASSFTKTTNCGATLAAYSSCLFTVSFAPTAAGSATATLVVTDNAGTGTQSATLTGIGAAPVVVVAPAALTFGSQAMNTTSNSQTVTVNNQSDVAVTISGINLGGASPGEFTQVSGCGPTLGAHSTCNVVVTFHPDSAASFSAALSVADTGSNSPQIVTLTGTGTAPGIQVSPLSIDFGAQTIGATTTQTATVSNTGGGPLTLTGITLAGASSFTQTNTCGATLAQGANCVITVTFAPSASGSQSAAITVANNAAGGTQTISLTGSASSPVVTLAPTGLTFGNQTATTASNTQTVTLNNQSGVAIAISGITIGGANPAVFKETDNCGTTLAKFSTCNIAVTFTPSAAGSFNAVLTVADSGASSPQTATLTGTGTAILGTLSVPLVDFGSITVGSSSSVQQVILTNSTAATMHLSASGINTSTPAAFTQTNNCGATLGPNGSCTFYVTFTPPAAGSFTGTLYVADDATGSPQTATLTGTAALPVVNLSTTSIAFGNQAQGTTSNATTVTLSNMSSAPVAISSLSIGGANPADFTETTTCGTGLSPYSTCNIVVYFTPVSAAAFTASLAIVDNAQGGTQTVTLTGTGTIPADYAVSSSSSSMTLIAGQSGTVTMTMTPTGGYKGTVTFAIGNLSSGITASFAPATLTADGSNTPHSTVLTINTQGPYPGTVAGAQSSPAFAGFLLLPAVLFGGVLAWRRKRLPGMARLLMMALVLGSVFTAMVGCGTPLATQPGTQSVTVTATAGATAGTSGSSISHTVNFTLIVKTP